MTERRSRARHARWAAAILLLPCLGFGAPDAAWLRDTGRGGVYQTPDEAEMARAEALFTATLEGPWDDALVAAWRSEGFELELSTAPQALLRELPQRRTGRGAYLFSRAPEARPLLLQAPHARDDLHTGEIARLLAAGQPLAAVAWNTLPRRGHDGVSNADLAHLEASHLLALSRAYARHAPRAPQVQIHGFAADKRIGTRAAELDVILSAGSYHPTPAVIGLASCLRRELTPRVGVFPYDVAELGGVTNRIGQQLRALGGRQFVHLELSRPLRERLRNAATARAALDTCLSETTL